MLELLLIPVLIILSFLYVKFKKAYLTQVLIIANFAVFIFYIVVAQIGSPMAYSMAENLTFMPARLGEIQYLPSIITSMFMHADPIHLIGNCLILYLIGLPLEERIGTRKWGIIYFATGIAATFSYYIMNIDSGSHLLGASGAIFGIGGAMLVLYPKDRIPMFIGPIFIRNAPVWLAVEVFGAQSPAGVGMACHRSRRAAWSVNQYEVHRFGQDRRETGVGRCFPYIRCGAFQVLPQPLHATE